MRKRKPYPTQIQARQMFEYTSNNLCWVQSQDHPGHAIDRKACKPDARSPTHRVRIDGKMYDLDLLVWIWHNGDLHDGFTVSHRDGDKDNSMIENLMLEPPHFTMRKQQAIISKVAGLRQALADGIPGDIGQDYFEINEILEDLNALKNMITDFTKVNTDENFGMIPDMRQMRESFWYGEGEFLWRVQNGGPVKIGDRAGTTANDSAVKIGINSALFRRKDLVWVFFNGDIPKDKMVVNINGNIQDDRIQNLQLQPKGTK